MKAYQAYYEYTNLSRSIYNRDKVIKSHGDQYHPTPEDAQADIDYIAKRPEVFKLHHSEILELDVPNSLVLEGTLKECGEYEDHHVYVQNDDDMIFTIDTTIRNHFLGRKVKITVELMEE